MPHVFFFCKTLTQTKKHCSAQEVVTMMSPSTLTVGACLFQLTRALMSQTPSRQLCNLLIDPSHRGTSRRGTIHRIFSPQSRPTFGVFPTRPTSPLLIKKDEYLRFTQLAHLRQQNARRKLVICVFSSMRGSCAAPAQFLPSLIVGARTAFLHL